MADIRSNVSAPCAIIYGDGGVEEGFAHKVSCFKCLKLEERTGKPLYICIFFALILKLNILKQTP